LRTETTDSPFTHKLAKGQVVKIPIGHMEGNYFCDPKTLDALKRDDRIVFRYSGADGEITAAANPNGSLENIAGILNEGRNVMGMMPHPDRSSERLLGSADGLLIFQSLVAALGVSA
jgi:phosphoribosylformylglycinamidine (FGAM) synthase-like amidotransferase family enzyme